MTEVRVSRIRIYAHRNLLGSNNHTLWSMLVGGEGYEVDLPVGFSIDRDPTGSPVIVTPAGKTYQPPTVIVGDAFPYLKLESKVYPLSNIERVM